MFRKVLMLTCLMLACVGCACADHTEKAEGYTSPNMSSPVDDIIEMNAVLADKNGDKRCGGTFIEFEGQPAVLSAAHCIMDRDELPLEYMFVFDGAEQYRVEIAKFSRSKDLALLILTDKPNQPLRYALVSMFPLMLGEDIWLSGFGAGVEDALSKGIVSKLSQEDWYGQARTQLDITGWYGNSGGGVYNLKHELVGVLVQFGPQGGATAGWMFAVKLSDINQFLYEREN